MLWAAWSLGRLPEQAQGEGRRATEMGKAICGKRDELDIVTYTLSPGI